MSFIAKRNRIWLFNGKMKVPFVWQTEGRVRLAGSHTSNQLLIGESKQLILPSPLIHSTARMT